MADTDDLTTTPAPTRVGSTADLARRMDRIEQRHETLEGEVRALAQSVARVAQNQDHATELNKLRFDALDSGLRSVSVQLTDFIKRVESILSGETETARSRELISDYRAWRASVEERLDAYDEARAKGEGVFATFSGARAVIVVLAAAATIVALILRGG